MNKKILSLILLLPLLGACQTVSTPVVVNYGTVAVPTAQPIVTHPFQWKVYNVTELRKLLAEQDKKPQSNFALFALTPEGYKALSLNVLEAERYIREQGQIIVFLKKTLDGRAQTGTPIGK